MSDRNIYHILNTAVHIGTETKNIRKKTVHQICCFQVSETDQPFPCPTGNAKDATSEIAQVPLLKGKFGHFMGWGHS